MSRSKFTKAQFDYLFSLPAVKRATTTRIYYTDEFRNDCMRRYRAGGSPARIFAEAGMGSDLIGYKRIERCIARWKKDEG